MITDLRSLEKCLNTYNYEYNEEDVRKMIAAIKGTLEEVKMSFDKGLSKNKIQFKI